jgi:Uma2 family endonuclease
MPVTESTYKKVALEDPNGRWELHCGQLRQKPLMSADHNQTIFRLLASLFQQLDLQAFQVRSDLGSVRLLSSGYYVPDIYVVPAALVHPQLGASPLEVFTAPLPLVIEVWSPSTGEYDVETKLPEYQARGDLEIWCVHPLAHTLRAWVRQPDGRYVETLHTGGVVRPSALAGVQIDLGTLFA